MIYGRQIHRHMFDVWMFQKRPHHRTVPADLRVPSSESQLERRPGGAEVVCLRQVLNASPRKLETLVVPLPAVSTPCETITCLPIDRYI